MEEEVLEEEIQVEEENYVVNADLSDYYTKEETDDLLDEKADITDIPDISGKQDLITSSNKLSSDLVDDSLGTNKFVTSQEKTTWNGKQNALTFDSTPTLNSNNPVTSNGIAVAIGSISGGGVDFIKIDFEDTVETRNTKIQQFYEDYLEDNNKCFLILTGLVHYFYGQTILMLRSFEVQNGSGTFTLNCQAIPPYTGTTTYYGVSSKYLYNYELQVTMQNGQVLFSYLEENQVGIIPDNDYDLLSTSNTTEYTPQGDYNPASKKYVDDIVGNINTVLATLTTVQGDN